MTNKGCGYSPVNGVSTKEGMFTWVLEARSKLPTFSPKKLGKSGSHSCGFVKNKE